MRVVGIGGYIGHGKDSAGSVLGAAGWGQVNFADDLKEEVLSRLRLTLKASVMSTVGNDLYDDTLPEDLRWTVERRVDEAWWGRRLRFDLWKRKPRVFRELLQEYGTEVRRADDPDYWVEKWTTRVRASLSSFPGIYATDVRFPNEVEAVRGLGGVVVKILRSGQLASVPHASERLAAEYDGWDVILVNDGSVCDLREKMKSFVLG